MIKSKSLRQTALTIWHQQRVKRLVRDRLGHGVQCMVSVREMICTDPGCEGPATEVWIVMLDFREFRAFLHKPLSEISASDVAAAI